MSTSGEEHKLYCDIFARDIENGDYWCKLDKRLTIERLR